MTSAQIPERLLYDDEALPMEGEPLAPWLAQQRLSVPGARSDCVRGYVGTWRLHGTRLCLVAIEPMGEGSSLRRDRDERPIELSLAALFGSTRPVWADWFTGRLRCPDLPCVRYSEFGIPQADAHDLVIDVAAGRASQVCFETPGAEAPPEAAPVPPRAAPRPRWRWPVFDASLARRWHLLPQRPAH